MTDRASAPPLWLAYARLFRLPNVFTALADIGMGLAFVGFQPAAHVPATVALALASALLYSAGMVLNDVFDVELDRVERPARPLPSGQIDLAWARALGFTLLTCGVVAAWAAGLLFANGAALPWRSGLLGLVLAALVVLYDRILKRTWLGPVGMGACRCGNVLLGMSLAGYGAVGPTALLGYERSQWLAAAGIGIYIVGVTWFARTEATTSRRGHLLAALGVMAGGIVLLGMIPHYAGQYGSVRFQPAVFWPVLLAALFVPLARRGGNAVIYPEPQRVQAVVKNSIQSLILFDAATAMAVHGPYWGLAILALLIPTLLLGRWIYST